MSIYNDIWLPLQLSEPNSKDSQTTDYLAVVLVSSSNGTILGYVAKL